MVNNRFDDLLTILGIDFIPDSRMSTDDILASLGCSVNYFGEILDSDGSYTGIFYDEIDKYFRR